MRQAQYGVPGTDTSRQCPVRFMTKQGTAAILTTTNRYRLAPTRLQACSNTRLRSSRTTFQLDNTAVHVRRAHSVSLVVNAWAEAVAKTTVSVLELG